MKNWKKELICEIRQRVRSSDYVNECNNFEATDTDIDNIIQAIIDLIKNFNLK